MMNGSAKESQTPLIDDLFALIQSSSIPMTMEELIQDAAVMPVGRGEPLRKVTPKQVATEIDRLIKQGKVESGEYGGSSELVYRLRRQKRDVQRELL